MPSYLLDPKSRASLLLLPLSRPPRVYGSGVGGAVEPRGRIKVGDIVACELVHRLPSEAAARMGSEECAVPSMRSASGVLVSIPSALSYRSIHAYETSGA
jgi:hypothetical protein